MLKMQQGKYYIEKMVYKILFLPNALRFADNAKIISDIHLFI